MSHRVESRPAQSRRPVGREADPLQNSSMADPLMAPVQMEDGPGSGASSAAPDFATMAGLKALSEEQAGQITTAPNGSMARDILKGPLKQSWNVAKHNLVGQGKGPEGVMWKLLDFRKEHHKQLLKDTSEEVTAVTGDAAGLDWEKSSGKGSDTLTSDIDVNLKGTQTEVAAQVFNKKFREDGWAYESGVVYDVNVYATDFMHSIKGVDDAESGKKLAQKEGATEADKKGGIKDQAIKELDADNQAEWASVKLRLYMTEEEWTKYKTDLDPENKKGKTWARVEAMYANYKKTLVDEMSNKAGKTLDAAEAMEASGAKQLEDTAKGLSGDSGAGAEDLQMSSANRIYERKLGEVKELRTTLDSQIAQFNASKSQKARDKIQDAIDINLQILRDKLSECSLYANEAYVTDAAVNHAVVGLQVGTKITQTKGESMNAVTENLADALKEIARHGDTLGEAAVKACKYMWRLADAAKNMGSNAEGVATLYQVGYDIANNIKGKADNPEAASDAMVRDKLGVSDVAGLKAKVMAVGMAVTKEYEAEIKSHRHELGAEVNKKGGETST